MAAPLIAAIAVGDGPPPALCSAIETTVNARQPTNPDLCETLVMDMQGVPEDAVRTG